MLKKERWIVYPLLMLSLFSSLIGVQVIRAQQQVLDMVETKELRVVNDEGEAVARIYHNDDGGAGLVLYNWDSGSSIMLATDELSSRLTLISEFSNKQVSLWSDDDWGHLSIKYGQHETRLQGDNEGGYLEFNGRYPMNYLSLGGDRESGGYLYLNNEKGDRRASLYQSANDHGGLWLYDRYGDKSRGYTFY